jgi:hypothetical protein
MEAISLIDVTLAFFFILAATLTSLFVGLIVGAKHKDLKEYENELLRKYVGGER